MLLGWGGYGNLSLMYVWVCVCLHLSLYLSIYLSFCLSSYLYLFICLAVIYLYPSIYHVCLSSKVGYDMTKKAAEMVFDKSGYTPQDVDVVELHDCFSANELITYEALGLCEPGEDVRG